MTEKILLGHPLFYVKKSDLPEPVRKKLRAEEFFPSKKLLKKF